MLQSPPDSSSQGLAHPGSVPGRASRAITNPDTQLPFSDFTLHFRQGAHGALRTPALCGTYKTTSSLTPWSAPDSGPPATPSESWQIAQGCAASENARPNSPAFDAGNLSPISKHYNPFVVRLSRDDGSQTFSALDVSPPPGLLAKLAGTEACSDADLAAAASKTGADEQASPSCPAASRVGSVHAAAGAGPSPYWASGELYLAGPYKGAPLSFAAITPAVAGPFDLGTIVVRAPVYIDPATAQVSTRTDAIPEILQGIPLDVRELDIALDRPEFTLTGTSCDPSSVGGLLTSGLGSQAQLSSRYQLSDCTRLGFRPRFRIALKGGTKRNGHPAFTTNITLPSGDYANMAKAQVVLPKQMQLDQSHIQAPCTRPQFAADQCPAASVIGTATARSPLVDYPLTGPVYLRTGDNPLPDVVLDLHGPASQPIRITQVGKIDTVHARLRTTFPAIPDAPLTSAVVSLVGGSKGLLVNNSDLCAQRDIASIRLNAQNNKVADSAPAVAVAGCKAHRHKHPKHHKRHRRR